MSELRSEIYKYTANIVSYDATTKLATLDKPVSISYGVNEGTSTSDGMGVITSTYSIKGKVTSLAKGISEGKAVDLSSDEDGNFYGIFEVPGNMFQTGQRVFRVDNRSTSTDPSTATTYAEATFTASGLSTIVKSVQFSPSIDSTVTRFTPSAKQGFQNIKTISGKTSFDPVAQTFVVSKDNYPNGIFITSVKLFFNSKPADNSSIQVYIVPTLNGFPDGDALDYSTVVKRSNEVKISENPHVLDSTTWTDFRFKAPVYIQAGETYAIVIQSSSSDYKLYYAQQNQFVNPLSTAKAKPTDATPTNPTKIGAIPSPGTFFESQNGVTWAPDLSKDLMFVVDRAVFDKTAQPLVNFTIPKGLPRRKMTGATDLQHKLDPTFIPSSGSLVSASSGKDFRIDALNITTTDFVPSSTKIDYTYSSTIRDGFVTEGPFTVIPGKGGNPTPQNIYFDDGKGPRILLSNSNTSFIVTAALSTSDANVSPILCDDGLTMYNIRYAINNMGLSNPVISLLDDGDSYNANTVAVTVSDPDIGSDKAVLSATVTNGKISAVKVLYGGSGYITTPTITIVDDTTRTGATSNAVVAVSGETSSSGGNGIARYITKVVTLAAGQDSGDLRVYYTAYRPLGTNIFVYYKIQNRNDNSDFQDLQWQLMAPDGGTNSYSPSRNSLIEYEVAPGTYSTRTANNYVTYSSVPSDGSAPQTYNTFYKFAIKIVLSSDDTTKIPYLTDLRVLALPSGTGI